MEIRLYTNFNKKINSTKRPTGNYTTKQVRLKEETSVMSPTFLLSDYDVGYNYLYVPKWGRYYFINDVTLNINSLWEVQCTFDSLATYKSNIGNTTTFIERTSDLRHIDEFLKDNAISADERVTVVTSNETEVFPSASVYVLRVMGRGSTHGIGTFIINYNDMKNIFSGVWGNVDEGSITDYITALANLYINDPSQYIVGVYRSPIGITTYLDNGTDDQTIYIGGHQTSLKAIRVDTAQTLIFGGKILAKPISTYTDFRKFDPAFTRYQMYIPTIGTVNLPNEIIDTELKMTLCADLFTGDLTFMLYSNGDIVATYNSNCYASVSVGVQNGSAGTSILTSAVATGIGIATMNPTLTMLPAVINGTKSILSPPASVIGTQGSIGAVETYPNIIITCIQKESAESPIEVYGKPCDKNLKISNVSGYIKCQNASIGNIAGTDRDKELVNNHLNGGFYYE